MRLTDLLHRNLPEGHQVTADSHASGAEEGKSPL
jgi:hypothetical protein